MKKHTPPFPLTDHYRNLIEPSEPDLWHLLTEMDKDLQQAKRERKVIYFVQLVQVVVTVTLFIYLTR